MKELLGKTAQFTIFLFITSLLVPASVLPKRPTTKYEPFLSEKIQNAREIEKRGEIQGAEEEYLNIYRKSKKDFKWRNNVNTWNDYMTSIRALISFYYRQGNFQEVDWYFREYHNEVEEDKYAEGMLLMLLQDVDKSVQILIDKKKIKEAELVYLDLEENLGRTLGYQHLLLGELYKRMAAFYIKTGNQEEGKKYAEKSSALMKE